MQSCKGLARDLAAGIYASQHGWGHLCPIFVCFCCCLFIYLCFLACFVGGSLTTFTFPFNTRVKAKHWIHQQLNPKIFSTKVRCSIRWAFLATFQHQAMFNYTELKRFTVYFRDNQKENGSGQDGDPWRKKRNAVSLCKLRRHTYFRDHCGTSMSSPNLPIRNNTTYFFPSWLNI